MPQTKETYCFLSCFQIVFLQPLRHETKSQREPNQLFWIMFHHYYDDDDHHHHHQDYHRILAGSLLLQAPYRVHYYRIIVTTGSLQDHYYYRIVTTTRLLQDLYCCTNLTATG